MLRSLDGAIAGEHEDLLEHVENELRAAYLAAAIRGNTMRDGAAHWVFHG